MGDVQLCLSGESSCRNMTSMNLLVGANSVAAFDEKYSMTINYHLAVFGRYFCNCHPHGNHDALHCMIVVNQLMVLGIKPK